MENNQSIYFIVIYHFHGHAKTTSRKWLTVADVADMDYLGLLWTVVDCCGLSWTVMDCHGLSWTNIDYLRLS